MKRDARYTQTVKERVKEKERKQYYYDESLPLLPTVRGHLNRHAQPNGMIQVLTSNMTVLVYDKLLKWIDTVTMNIW